MPIVYNKIYHIEIHNFISPSPSISMSKFFCVDPYKLKKTKGGV